MSNLEIGTLIAFFLLLIMLPRYLGAYLRGQRSDDAGVHQKLVRADSDENSKLRQARRRVHTFTLAMAAMQLILVAIALLYKFSLVGWLVAGSILVISVLTQSGLLLWSRRLDGSKQGRSS